MRPTFPQCVAVVKRSALPKHLQERVVPPPPRPSEKLKELTLIDHLIARREERNKAYAAAQQRLQENGELEAYPSIKPWPVNLRIEPVIKREVFSKVAKEARLVLRQALKER